MKKYLLILTFILSALSSQAQNPFPDFAENQTWRCVEYPMNWGQGKSCYEYSIELKDTVSICEYQYREFFFCVDDSSECVLAGYYRIQGDSIMIRRVSQECDEPEGLLYDFGMEVGDSVEVVYDYIDTRFFWKESDTTLIFEGIERKVHVLNYIPHQNGTFETKMLWIEGIGTLQHPIYSWLCNDVSCENVAEPALGSSHVDGKRIYSDSLAFCNDVISGISEDTNEIEISIFPNPVQNTLFVKGSYLDTKYYISNTLGEIIQKGKVINGEIPLDDLSPSLYLILIQSKNKHKVFKIIIQK